MRTNKSSLFFCPPLITGIRGGDRAHRCWQTSRSAGAARWSQRYLSISLCSLQRHGNHRCSMISVRPSVAIVLLNSRDSNRPPHRPVKNGWIPFAFSPRQHVQMGACHWVIVLLSLLRDLPDLKPVVLHDWKSAVVPFAELLKSFSGDLIRKIVALDYSVLMWTLTGKMIRFVLISVKKNLFLCWNFCCTEEKHNRFLFFHKEIEFSVKKYM